MFKAVLMFSFVVGLMASDYAAARAYGRACTSTPAQIVASVYVQISDNKALEPQVSHINIQYTNYDENGDNGAIKIQGWADSQKDYDNVVEIALETACVTRVNEQGFATPKPEGLLPRGGGCDPPATKECGDICIPGNDTCNIGKSGGE